MTSTNRFAAWLLALCAVALLAGCATGPRIATEADPEADFSKYRTFAFYSPLAIEREGYASASSERMKAAARTQMESRGYVFTADRPDLWVNINAFTERRTDVSRVPTMDYAWYYSYRANRYFAMPYWRDDTHVYRYTEGTLNVDLVDAAKNRLVWGGVAVGRVSSKQDAGQRDASIDATMAEIFARYPYRAGQVPAAAMR